MQSKSKMRVHILHGIPQQQQQQQHHVASYSLSHTQRVAERERERGRGREAERQSVSCISSCMSSRIYRLRLAATVHCSVLHTHTHTPCTFSQFSQTVRHNCLCTPYTPTPIFFWYLQCFIVAAIFGSSNVIWVSSQLLA